MLAQPETPKSFGTHLDLPVTNPINLNKFRKAKARSERVKRADENAVKFGRTKAEKTADKAETVKTANALDQKRRDDR